jgi:glycosyltransferase involved in cell wall biosynthesis
MSEAISSGTKRRLIISYSYKPANNPRAFRWSAIAEYWVKQGYGVDVVCAWKTGLPRQEIVNGVNVYRVSVTAIELFRKLLGKTDLHLERKDPKDFQSINDFNLKNSWVGLVKKIILLIWKKIYWPDSVCFWYFPAVNQAEKLLKANKYEALVSVSLPFTGHLVGWQLKKQFPYIKWIVDVGDPFSFQEFEPINNPQFYKKINYLFERQAFRQADGISVTTKKTLEKYVELFPEIENKIEIIPPLISIYPKYQDQLTVLPKNSEKIRMVFVGRLYKNIRNPDFLLKLFTNLLDTSIGNRLELHFFGETQDCHHNFQPYRKLIGSHLFLHGIVNHSQAIQAMKDSDILINIGNQTNYQLPSKIVEYASIRKRIINISKISEDSSTEFLKQYPLALCLLEKEDNDYSQIIQKITNFIVNIPEDTVVDTNQWHKPFQIEEVAFKYNRILSKSSAN